MLMTTIEKISQFYKNFSKRILLVILTLLFSNSIINGQFGIGTSYDIPIKIGYFGCSIQTYNLIEGIGLYFSQYSNPKFSDADYYYPYPGDECWGSYTGEHKSATCGGLTFKLIDYFYTYIGYSRTYQEEWTTYLYYSNDFYYPGIYEVDDYNHYIISGVDFGIKLFFSDWTGLSFGYNTSLHCFTFGMVTSFFTYN